MRISQIWGFYLLNLGLKLTLLNVTTRGASEVRG